MVDAAFQGFTAIPASASAGIQVRPKRPWHEVLRVAPDAPREVIEAAGKVMQRKTPAGRWRKHCGLSGGAGCHRRVEPMTIWLRQMLRCDCPQRQMPDRTVAVRPHSEWS
jgi:hypothetical protein